MTNIQNISACAGVGMIRRDLIYAGGDNLSPRTGSAIGFFSLPVGMKYEENVQSK